MKRSVRVLTAAFLGAAIPSGFVRAADVVRLGLAYDAETSCPSGSDFARLVKGRAPSVDLTAAGPEQADVIVAIHPVAGRWIGSLQIRRADGTRYAREIPAASCDELGSALAFVAALALSGQEELPLETPEAPEVTAPREELAPARRAAPTPSGPVLGWGLGIGVGFRGGFAPTWAFTEEVDVEVRWRSDSTVSPVFRVGAIHADPVTRIDRAGSTKFTWTTTRAAGCPLRIRPFARLELRPCIGVDLGVIGASGTPSSSTGRGHDALSPWVDAFGALRLQFRAFGPLVAFAEGETVLPLTRHEFAFDPDTPVYDVPAVAGAGLAGLALEFP